MAGSTLAAARRDYDAARALLAEEARRALAPSIPRGAGTWFASRLDAERERLAALERHVRALARTSAAGTTDDRPSPAADNGDVAVDVAPARALLDHAPEPLVQRVRAELGRSWRDALPTLLDLHGAARRLVGTPRVPPWVERRDVARALLPRLSDALAALARDQDQLVPRGLAVRRLALLPEPVAGEPPDIRVDRILPSSGEAHLVVAWRAE
jgi:hypothetical protein